MDDDRVWEFEKSLWTGDADQYRTLIDGSALLVVPAHPFILEGDAAADAMARTPRWSEVEFSEGRIVRPQEGLIVLAYRAKAKREDGEAYEAHCSSTLRRLSHEEWRVVQHQQTPPLTVGGS